MRMLFARRQVSLPVSWILSGCFFLQSADPVKAGGNSDLGAFTRESCYPCAPAHTRIHTRTCEHYSLNAGGKLGRGLRPTWSASSRATEFLFIAVAANTPASVTQSVIISKVIPSTACRYGNRCDRFARCHRRHRQGWAFTRVNYGTPRRADNVSYPDEPFHDYHERQLMMGTLPSFELSSL